MKSEDTSQRSPRLVGEFSLQRTQEKVALCLISSVCVCDPPSIQRHSSLCAIPFLSFALDHNNQLRSPFNRVAVSKKRLGCAALASPAEPSLRLCGGFFGSCGEAAESHPAEREELQPPTVAQVLALSCLAELISGGRRRAC